LVFGIVIQSLDFVAALDFKRCDNNVLTHDVPKRLSKRTGQISKALARGSSCQWGIPYSSVIG
jgi:hypothetical protein